MQRRSTGPRLHASAAGTTSGDGAPAATGTQADYVPMLEGILERAFVELSRETLGTIGDCRVSLANIEQERLSGPMLAERLEYPAGVIQMKEDRALLKHLVVILGFPGTFVFPGKMLLIQDSVLQEMVDDVEDNEGLLDAISEIGNLLTGCFNDAAERFRETLPQEGPGLPHVRQGETLVFDAPSHFLEGSRGLLADRSYRCVSCQLEVEDFPSAELILLVGESNFEEPQKPAGPQQSTARQRAVAPTAVPRSARTRSGSIGALMTRPVVTAPPDAPVLAALRIMTERSIAHLPIVDGGELIGAVSQADLLSARSIFLTPKFAKYKDKKDERTAQFPLKAFMRKVRGVPPTLTLAQAAALQAREPAHVLFVVDPQGKLMGIFTVTDLLRALAARARGGAR